MQLGFADSDNYDMNIVKADDNLEVTKRLKRWFSTNGDVKLSTFDDIRRKVRGTMVQSYTLLIRHFDVCAGFIQRFCN